MQRYQILILLTIFVLNSGLLVGCGSLANSDIIPSQAEELSLDYQDDFMLEEGLVCTYSYDIVKGYHEWGMKEAAEKFKSARHVRIEPLRKSSAPYEEIEHVVKLYKTERLAKEAFNEWSEPIWGLKFIGGDWYSLTREPIRHRYESIQVCRIGDENKAWRTIECEFIIVFRKGRALEALAVNFRDTKFLEHILCCESLDVPLEDERLIEWSVEIAQKAESCIPDSYIGR